MRYKKLFLASVVLFVLVSLSFVGSVGASSEMWSQTYESGRHQTAYSLVETSDGGYAIAGSSGFQPSEDFCLVKTDEMGFMQWLKTFGGNATEIAYSVVETSDGGYVLAGGTASFGAGSYDFWLVKTDANGIMQWNKTYGGPDSEKAYSLVKTFDGGYALSGDGLLVKTDVYGNMEWNQTYDGKATALIATSDGGYAFLISPHMWIKTDAQGIMEWKQTYETRGFMEIRNPISVIETSDGGYALAGDKFDGFSGTTVFWVIKTDAQGIIPEFPSCIILPLFLTTTLAIIICKQRLTKNTKTNRNHSY